MKVRRFLLLGFAFFLMLGSKVSQAQSECELNYSLYREYFKQWKQAKYNPENLNPQMITSWRYVFNNCPDFKQTTYVEGVSIIANAFIRHEKNPEIRDKYIDTLIMVYDRRAQYFGASGIGNIMGCGDGIAITFIFCRMGYDRIGISSIGIVPDGFSMLTQPFTEGIAIRLCQISDGIDPHFLQFSFGGGSY